MATSSTIGLRRWRALLALAAIACRASSFPLYDSRIRTMPRGGGIRIKAGAGTRLHSSNKKTMKKGSTKRRRRPRVPESNLYELLGADPAMSRAEIKRRYIALAKRTHPDSSFAAANESKFNEIARAWSVLSDPRSRRAYDRELAAQDFKDGVVSRASKVAKEYGPVALKLYEVFAIPFLRRTTATTLAGWNAVRTVTRQIDGMEMGEKSMGLGAEADESRAEGIPGAHADYMMKLARMSDAANDNA